MRESSSRDRHRDRDKGRSDRDRGRDRSDRDRSDRDRSDRDRSDRDRSDRDRSDRDRSDRDRSDRDRSDRDRSDRERLLDRERSGGGDYYRSKSPSRSRSSKPKKSKRSKKKYSSRRSRSSSRSSTNSNSSDSSSRSSKSRSRNPRTPISETLINTSVTQPIKGIDLSDSKVQKALETIDEDSFAAAAFSSSRDREAPAKPTSDKVIIDLNAETVIVPKPVEKSNVDNEIIHPNFLGDAEIKAEKWIRKLYNYRQKYIQE